MSPHEITIPTAIVAFKTVTLGLGALITFFAYRAYRRTGRTALWYLAIGFAIVTLGSLLGGVLDQFLASAFRIGLLVESALLTVGFAVIVYSLYVEI
ncbi:MAG: hypothetical protein ABEH64_00100 [Salinirussus sp.]